MNMSKNTRNVKPYCKVCHDAGKTETEYRSHFVRENPDPNSKIVCPTLLDLECKYCLKKGHTRSYCGILKKQESQEARNQRTTQFTEKTSSVKASSRPKDVGRFQALVDEDNSEPKSNNKTKKDTIKIVEKKDEFPQLAEPSFPQQPVLLSYKKALETVSPEVKKSFTPGIVPIPSSAPAKRLFTLNWADAESSSDEEDNWETDEPYYADF